MKNYFEMLNFNKLTECQEKIKNIDINKNVIKLADTGSGKTESAYYWALNRNNKTIFVQPLKTLATSIYNRLNTYNEKLHIPESWTIQHSSIQQDNFLSNKYSVTTIDQVLTGWLGLGRQGLVKGKNVLLSDLIFDEIQLFDPNISLQTTINMLKSINNSNKRFMIMTATMPEYLIDFLQKQFDMETIICEKDSIENKKVNMKYTEILDFNNINKCTNKQIVICNTQSEQIEFYNSIKDKSRIIVLNNKLLPNDRKNIEVEVLKYFGKDSKDNDKILISTKIIEAGIDISANILYSSEAPIDSLIQRAGRCCRWGGNGEFIVFKTRNYIYDSEIVTKTTDTIKQYNDCEFNWNTKKILVNKVLNDYYKEYINVESLHKNKQSLKASKKNDLIRDMCNVNIIVNNQIKKEIHSNTNIENIFQKQGISINIKQLKKISENNKLYIKNKKDIEEINTYEIEIGDNIIIEGNDCKYDELGFRLQENEKCTTFAYNNEATIKNKYNDYQYETWNYHSESVRDLVKSKIIKDNFCEKITENADSISNILGLHDIGKLDELWQGELWADAKDEPLAHFPFRKGNGLIFKDRHHAEISAFILKEYCDNTLFNVILQHHKRYIKDRTFSMIKIQEFKLHKKYKECLKKYNFTDNVLKEAKVKRISDKDIIYPHMDNWNQFLYLSGILIESDIESIKK